ncbi:nicotinate-nucleotide--dimethylbenzimidazole phosphoribosyltransferase [Mariprofundus micogutta]|uniref:Nicotinate-nucleotide--dimethylbenzimidazole phosphoribosyltransferase n=1 Tax=Mariprofundus micogutta TaxID=1921010 RepID=A0A1L8CNL1_9PROT|nr:nicotinate-nucleotide--dimethylbenzimidazole phosphoribosyltransferase [Mariprofundus micogutta]GAV20501.1 nicotinate-nucleotide--dimethylbenzimidazole phosphoribosyltransferase [Mariprofundus micogutta]
MEIPSIYPDKEYHSNLIQPSGCMGRMEDIAAWFSTRQGKKIPDAIKPAVVLFASDHNITSDVDYGESTTTAERTHAALDKNSIIRKLCKQGSASLLIVDLGVREKLADMDDLEQAKIRTGSGNIAQEAAMDQGDYWESTGIGEEIANRMIADGANLLIAGSISANNEVSVAAIISELVGLSPEEVLRSSSNGSPEIYAQELIAVEAALSRTQGTPSHDILRELGGFELAAMAGFYRAAAHQGVPVLLDDLASTAAALAAAAWDVRIAGWMLASHVSSDNAGQRHAIDDLGLEPLMELNKSIGEARVATLLIPVIQSALSLQAGLVSLED